MHINTQTQEPISIRDIPAVTNLTHLGYALIEYVNYTHSLLSLQIEPSRMS
jgi:hypothetical protein